MVKVLTSTDANGNVSRLAYDQLDRLASVADPVGRITVYGYDAMSRRISASNPAIQATPLQLVQFTPDGLVASLTDALGNVLTSTYDGFDRLASLAYPAAGTEPATRESSTYDADGNVQIRTTRRGDTISFSYDTLNRLTTKTEPSGTPSVTYGYDVVNHLTSVSDTSASIPTVTGSSSLAVTAAYDARNEPISVSWTPAAAQVAPTTASVTFTHAYDATNRRFQQVANDNSWIAYPAATGTTGYTVNALNQYSAVGSVMLGGAALGVTAPVASGELVLSGAIGGAAQMTAFRGAPAALSGLADAAVSAQTGVLGVLGTVYQSCSGSGCGPDPFASYAGPANPPKGPGK